MMESKLSDGTKVRRVVYDMKSFMEQCVERYLTVAGPGTKLKKVGTPFLADTSGTDVARLGGPVMNEQFVCPTCRVPFSPTEEGRDITPEGWVHASKDETVMIDRLLGAGGGNREPPFE